MQKNVITNKKFSEEKNNEVKLLLTGKMQRLYKEMVPALRRFPKTQKYTLASAIENELLSSIKLLLGATYQKEQRLQRLKDVRLNFHTINFLLRASHESGCMSIGLYEQFSIQLNEMGKMSSAWIKSETSTQSSQ